MQLKGLRDIAASRAFWAGLLFLFALCYYGSYYRHGLNFRDEGGTVALIAQRLNNGELPFTDVTLGYNIGWFYPVQLLYKVFGTSYIVLRVWCFALSTLAALLGFWAIARALDHRCGGKVWRHGPAAFVIGVLLVVVPGSTFKNYIPLAVIANSLALLAAALAPPSTRRAVLHGIIGGTVLGLTALVRIDLAIFTALLWPGLLLFRTLDRTHPLRQSILTATLLFATAALVHLPAYIDARQRGFSEAFVAQYPGWVESLSTSVTTKFLPQVVPAGVPSTAIPNAVWDEETLARKGVSEAISAKKPEARSLAALTYLPLLSIVPLSLWAFFAWLYRAIRRRTDTAAPLAALAVLGGALTAFPQFFFFRPDAPHLSEFSPGFWVAVMCATILLTGRITGLVIAVCLTLHTALFLSRMLPDRWTGTIAARNGRTRPFNAENGVNVLVNRRELEGLTTLRDLLHQHSKPGEYVVVYPYHPTINVLADRPTYEKNVYVDNAIRTVTWDYDAIARFEKYKPAVIVLSEWDVNGTEASRFSIFAARTKTWVQTHYRYQGTYLEFEVYVR